MMCRLGEAIYFYVGSSPKQHWKWDVIVLVGGWFILNSLMKDDLQRGEKNKNDALFLPLCNVCRDNSHGLDLLNYFCLNTWFFFFFRDSYFVPSPLERSQNVLSVRNLINLEGASYSNALNLLCFWFMALENNLKSLVVLRQFLYYKFLMLL